MSRPSPRLFAAFAAYGRWYLRRHFHAVRRSGPPPRIPAGAALVVYCNHPSWWDPMLAIHLAATLFPARTHHGPIDAAALRRYPFFRRLGFFGVQPGVAGARRFLRVAGALVERPGSALWITPEGRFTDPRQRPVRLRPGLGRLAARLARRSAGEGGGEAGRGSDGTAGGSASPGPRRTVLLPLALEYPFWEERTPEALLRFGEPLELPWTVGEPGPPATAAAWDRLLARRLEAAQDALRQAAMARDPAAFEVMLAGRAGVGGVYDLWRAAKAAVRGERFNRQHGGPAR